MQRAEAKLSSHANITNNLDSHDLFDTFDSLFRFIKKNTIIPKRLAEVSTDNKKVEALSTAIAKGDPDAEIFTHPNFSQWQNPLIYEIAVTIAIIASLETLLSVEAIDKLDPYKRVTPTNRELKVQGIGNIAAGLLGGIPVTQVIVRSSANIDFGARTKMSTICHGLLLLTCAIIIPKILNLIPLAALSAILIMVGYKLAKPLIFIKTFKLGWEQFTPFIATVIAILFSDLLIGISIGMSVAIFAILRHNYKNPYYMLTHEQKEGHELTIFLAEEVSFLNKGSILQELNHIPENAKVTIDGTHSKVIDYDVLEIIHNFLKTSKTKNIQVELKGID